MQRPSVDCAHGKTAATRLASAAAARALLPAVAEMFRRAHIVHVGRAHLSGSVWARDDALTTTRTTTGDDGAETTASMTAH